jgi:hypothetical protein
MQWSKVGCSFCAEQFGFFVETVGCDSFGMFYCLISWSGWVGDPRRCTHAGGEVKEKERRHFQRRRPDCVHRGLQ